jgi:hypothetical protein
VVAEVMADSRRIEQTRNVICSIWPNIVVHHDGDQIRLETGPVSAGFATALSSTTECAGFAGRVVPVA